MQSTDKLYLVTRKDIAPGYQAVQSCHALRQFTEEHPEIDKQWFKTSNYLCLLAVKNEEELYSLVCQAKDLNVRVSVFREPDIDNQITAIALEPGSGAKELCKNLKLALKDI